MFIYLFTFLSKFGLMRPKAAQIDTFKQCINQGRSNLLKSHVTINFRCLRAAVFKKHLNS